MSSPSKPPSASSSESGTGVMPPALRKKLQQCYEHGTKLMQQPKYDFDYAHSILVECVLHDPGNVVYVEAFLQNLQRKYNNNKRGALLAIGGKGPFKKALAKRDWAEVLKLGPEILRTNPWEVATLRGMAEACAEFGHYEAELRYLKNALAPNPKDPEVNKHCAQSLARIGQFDQAIICWQRVDEAKRGDDEAQRMISELQIEKTRGRAGFAASEAARKNAAAKNAPSAKDSPATAAAESPPAEEPEQPPPRREIKLTRRQQLEQDIANRPTDLDPYFELAQLHIDESRLAEAAHVLSKAQAVSGNGLKVQEKIEDVEILRKREQLEVAERRANANPTEAHQQLVQQLREDLYRIELEVFDRRVQRYPQDLELKFQLGLRLKRVGNFREAMKYFDESQQLPNRRAGSILETGECLQRLKRYDLALERYRQAADRADGDKTELQKLALYRMGVLAEGLKHWDLAEIGFTRLLELDADYKDAATRLDKLREMRHKHS